MSRKDNKHTVNFVDRVAEIVVRHQEAPKPKGMKADEYRRECIATTAHDVLAVLENKDLQTGQQEYILQAVVTGKGGDKHVEINEHLTEHFMPRLNHLRSAFTAPVDLPKDE